jgi:translation initiation factor 1
VSRGKKLDLFNRDFGEMKDFFQNEDKLPSEHKLKIQTEKRRGKTVTVIKEFFVPEKEQKKLLKLLKSKLSTGGTFKDRAVEIQGDFGLKAKELLQKEGFNF